MIISERIFNREIEKVESAHLNFFIPSGVLLYIIEKKSRNCKSEKVCFFGNEKSSNGPKCKLINFGSIQNSSDLFALKTNTFEGF